MDDLNVVFEMSDTGMAEMITTQIEEEGGSTTNQIAAKNLALTLPVIVGGVLTVVTLVKVIFYVIREFRCRSILDLTVDPPKNTVDCSVRDGRLILITRDGQTVEVSVSAAGGTAHFLPQSALTLNDDGDLGVRLVSEDETATFAPVDLLRDTTEGVYVDGLPDEAQVIVVGQEFVSDGVSLDVTLRERPE